MPGQTIIPAGVDVASALAAIREGARQAVADYLEAHPLVLDGLGPPSVHVDGAAPSNTPDRPRTAQVRGVWVHTDGAPAVTFTKRRGQCPQCSKRLELNHKIIGFQRVDSPDLLLWVCAACANKLVRS